MGLQSLRDKITALPPEEYAARRALFTDDEWHNSWEVNGYPFQLPPPGDEWRFWSVYSPPGVGSSRAGVEWVFSVLQQEGAHVAVILYEDINPTNFAGYIYSTARPDEPYSLDGGTIGRARTEERSVTVVPYGSMDVLLGMEISHVWADNATDANVIVKAVPNAQRYVFTDPLRPVPSTLVSRAGDERTL